MPRDKVAHRLSRFIAVDCQQSLRRQDEEHDSRQNDGC